LSYFVRKVTDFEVVWGLRNDAGWFMSSTDAGLAFPVWPEHAFAAACAVDDCRVEPIALDHFMNVWLPGLEKEGQRVLVFPLSTGPGSVCPPGVLLAELKAELAQYE
jgi:hypothetical protein